MNRWILSLCFSVLAAVPAAAADVRLDSYRNPQNEGMRNACRLDLDVVKGGLMAYNAWLNHHGGQPAFCMPEHLAMTTEQTEDIMLKSAEERVAKGDMLVSLLLLSGLKDSFPCDTAGSGSDGAPKAPYSDSN